MKKCIIFLLFLMIFTTTCDDGGSEFLRFAYNGQEYEYTPTGNLNVSECTDLTAIAYQNLDARSVYLTFNAVLPGQHTSETRSINLRIYDQKNLTFASTYSFVEIIFFNGKIIAGRFNATNGTDTVSDGYFRAKIQNEVSVQMNSSCR